MPKTSNMSQYRTVEDQPGLLTDLERLLSFIESKTVERAQVQSPKENYEFGHGECKMPLTHPSGQVEWKGWKGDLV